MAKRPKLNSRKHRASRMATVVSGASALALIAREASEIVTAAHGVWSPLSGFAEIYGFRIALAVTVAALVFAVAQKLWQEQDANEGRYIERGASEPFKPSVLQWGADDRGSAQ